MYKRQAERDANQARRSRRVTESRRRADLSGRLTRRRVAHAEAEEARQAEAESELDELQDTDLIDDEEVVDVDADAFDEDGTEDDTDDEDDTGDDTEDDADGEQDDAADEENDN